MSALLHDCWPHSPSCKTKTDEACFKKLSIFPLCSLVRRGFVGFHSFKGNCFGLMTVTFLHKQIHPHNKAHGQILCPYHAAEHKDMHTKALPALPTVC